MKTPIYLRYSARHLTVRVRYLTYAVAMAIAIYSGNTLAQTVDFPPVPLTVAIAVPANLLYIHDDSNSMYWSYMPDDIHRFRVPGLSTSSAVPYQFYMSPEFNKMYYNPAVKYVPPPAPPGVIPVDADGRSVTDGTLGNAKYTNAWFNGYDLVNRNKSGYYASDTSFSVGEAQFYEIPHSTVANARNTAFHRFDLSKDFTPTDEWSLVLGAFYGTIGSYRLDYSSEFQAGAPTGQATYYMCKPSAWIGYPAPTADASNYKKNECTQYFLNTDEEKQNFANWYSYYRTRNYASKAGIGRAFEKLDSSVRVGWGLINKRSLSSVDGKSVDTVMQGVRKFDQTQRTNFLDWLYKIQPVVMNNPPVVSQLLKETNDGGATPLRKALDSAGQYFDRRDGAHFGPWADNPDPANKGSAATEKAAACRKSFTILMTDGYWNRAGADTPGIKNVNVDGDAPNPFRDDYANTLADVAWYYWKNKLLPDTVANKVPKTPAPGTLGSVPPKYRNDAEHQHMTTFTIGLGVAGSVDKDEAFRAIHDPSVGTITWPNPVPDEYTREKIDDLLHAAVNGHGDFFSASNPDEFVAGMSSIINAVNSAQKASSGSIDASSSQVTPVSTDVYIYKTHFKPDDWRGELIAQKINYKTGLLEEVWRASERMPSPGARKIYTRNSNSGAPFVWGNLDEAHKTALRGPGQLLNAQQAQEVLDYIRGSNANEGSDPGKFRPRYRYGNRAPLGDSPHNSPLFVKYGTTATVFLGGNDGMLHAFNALDEDETKQGTEQFAYIPSALIPKLSELTNGHGFYVDGEIFVTTPAQTPKQHLLVGALGRGGKGLYGLDVSDPANFTSSHVKWELNNRQTCSDSNPDYLGNIIGSLAYAEVGGSPSAVFGNGYNSCSGRAALGIVNVSTGNATFIKASNDPSNGLAAPAIWGAISAYAGDLHGKMWRFGLTPLLDVPQLLFAVGTANQDQPITAQPVVKALGTAPDVKKTFVYFGTGRYLSISDRSTTAQQSIYGLVDENSSTTISPDDLQLRTFGITDSVGGIPVKSIVPLAGNANMDKKGWHIPLIDKGERVVSAPIIVQTPRGDVAVFTTVVPPADGDPCDPKGSGWLYAVNAQTGGALDFIFLDLNGDGKFDANDTHEGGTPSAIKIGDLLGGMPGQVRMVNGRLVVCGLDSDACIDPQVNLASGTAQGGRISWREIIN
jgi:type IV pilus assembly protein PilY1